MSKRSVAEFVNKLFELQTKGHVLLYKGPISGGGYTEVSIQSRRADGYSQLFYDIKQVIAEEGKQAHIQKVNIPSETFVYELIKESIEDESTRVCKRQFNENKSESAEFEINSSDYADSSESINEEQPIDVVRVDIQSNKKSKTDNVKTNVQNEQSDKGLPEIKYGTSNNSNKLTSPAVAGAISLLDSEY